MWLVWMAVLMVVLKWLEVAPVAAWSWYWVLAPLGAAFIWFEFLERLLGRDQRTVEMAEHERRAKERIANSWKTSQRR